MDTFVRFAAFLVLGGLVAWVVNSVFSGGWFVMPVLATILIAWALWQACGGLPS